MALVDSWDLEKLKGPSHMEAMYEAESILAAAFKMLEKGTSLGFDRKALLLGRMMCRVTLLLTKKQGKGREAHEWADLAEINEALMAECLGKHTAASGSKSEPEGGPALHPTGLEDHFVC